MLLNQTVSFYALEYHEARGPLEEPDSKELVTGRENLKTDRQKGISRQMPHVNKYTETRKLVRSFKKNENDTKTKAIGNAPWAMR